MTLLKKTVGVAALLTATSAMAVPTFTAPGGATFDPFGGIDWASNGTAYTSNFNQAAAIAGTPFSFTTNFISFAKSSSGIFDTSSNAFTVPNLFGGTAGSGANPFEVTIFATINETAICSAGGVACTFLITGGSFDIRLDTTTDARAGAGAALAQYQNGTQLIAGSITSGIGSFISFPSLGNGSGFQSFLGQVTYTNPTYISPTLGGSTATGTLQLGSQTTGWTLPAFLGANNCTPTSTACRFAFQADANQGFSIPEPGSLALIGIVALGAGAAARRKRAV